MDILQQTFGNIMITKEVVAEFGQVPHWITVQHIKDRKKYEELMVQLDDGEASAIALALETDADLLIIDERKGRKIAENLGLVIIGSLGILLKAKQKGVITSVKAILDLIDQTNFRISTAIKRKILKAANE